MEKKENVYEENSPAEEFAEASEEGALTVLGKFKDVGALARAYESLQAEFTRRSQRLRQLEKEAGNFKKENASASGAEKLRKAAKVKREEQKEFDAFVADMVSPSAEEMKSDEVSMDEEKPIENGAKAQVFSEGEHKKNEREGKALETEKLVTEQAEAAPIAKEEGLREVEKSVAGSKAQGFTDDLFERAVNDEAVRLRIIGEYLSSLGKSNAPLTAAGAGTFAAPPVKAKSVGEAGNMALLYFRKPIV